MADEPAPGRLVRLRGLPEEYHRSGTRILAALRRDHAAEYGDRSEEVATALAGEETRLSPAMLGTIDTFVFEAESFLTEAFRLLDTRRWTEGRELAGSRLAGDSAGKHSFWLNRDRNLARVWRWAAAAAALGEAIAEVDAVPDRSADLASQTTEYLERRWKVDRVHRSFTLQSANLGPGGIDAHMPVFSRIRSGLVHAYRAWIDRTIRAWNAACERDGFFPASPERQRFFFRRHVAPALRNGSRTAVVLADGLRYELGCELEERLRSEHLGTAELSAMLAELPTTTAVGMSALAPTVDGDELVPVFSSDGGRITGFRGGMRDVTSPASREKTFADASPASRAPGRS